MNGSFPKAIGWISLAAAVLAGLAGLSDLLPASVATSIGAAAAIAAALSHSIGGGMIPKLPKVAGYIGIASALFGALNATDVLSMVSPGVGKIIVILAGVLAVLARSIPGDGALLTTADKA